MVSEGDILVVIDVQNDFVTGSLAVPGAEEILPVVNEWINKFVEAELPVIFTEDCHPEDHVSFDTWAVHCVKGTEGAKIHTDIIKDPASYGPDEYIEGPFWYVEKGRNPQKDCYSGFCADEDSYGEDTYMDWLLDTLEITHLYVCGLATDYCVKATVLDALKRGLSVTVIRNAIRAVNVNPDDGVKAIREMREAGARFI